MALNHSPSIVTNGLAFAYDMANIQKSWKGKPTTNLITSPNPTTVGGAWGVTGLSAVTANAAIAPDGTLTATKLVASTSNTTFQFIAPASSSQPTGTITYSCHMKAGEYTTGSLFLTQSGNNGAVFNLTNGTVVSVTGTGNTAAITPHPNGNGWWRCSVTNTGGTVSAGYRVGPLNGCLANVGGDGVSGIYVWNCQAEQQSFATPFVSGTRSSTQAIVDLTNTNTVTANLTYASDNTFSFDGTRSISFTNPLSAQTNLGQEWTVIAWVNIDTSINQRLITGLNSSLYLTTGSNSSLLYLNGGVNDYYTYGGAIGGVGWCQVVFRFRNSDGARTIYKNGVNISTGGPNLTSIPSGNLGTLTLGTSVNGLISNTMIYNRYITDAEVLQNFNALRGRYGL